MVDDTQLAFAAARSREQIEVANVKARQHSQKICNSTDGSTVKNPQVETRIFFRFPTSKIWWFPEIVVPQ